MIATIGPRRRRGAARIGLPACLAFLVSWPAAVWAQEEPAQPPQAPVTARPEQPPGLPPLPSTGISASGAGPASRPSAGPLEAVGGALPLPGGPGEGRRSLEAPPGLPPRGGRPLPGGVINPGASGPGITRGRLLPIPSGEQAMLGGAFDPRTGWPFVLLDHFRPKPERVARLWVVQTRACPQVMGSDPWPCLRVLHFNDRGELEPRSPDEMFAQTLGHPVLIQVQGNRTTADAALGGLLWTHSWLELNRAIPPDAVLIAFDWPSHRIYRNDARDIDEKGRRAYVAGYHLARFIQGFPPGSRIALLGQSYGGRAVPAALHLLAGGSLNSQDHDPPVRLPTLRSDLHLRAIALEAASDHEWLDPDKRFDRALAACEGFLNLYNRRDEALYFYPLLKRSNHHRALGRIGLTNKDFRRLGPIASRYVEHDIHDVVGSEHSLLDSVANAQAARWMAPYLWAPDPGPTPPRPNIFAPEFARDRGGGIWENP